MKEKWIKRVLGLSAKLPLRLNHGLGAFLGKRLARGNATEKRTAQTNIELCFPELSAERKQQLVEQSLIETGKTIIESGVIWFSSQQRFFKLVKEVHGEKYLKAGLDNGKGVILSIPHLGNWEAIGMYCSSHYPMTSLYRPPRLSGMDDVIRTARQRFGAKLVPTNAKGVKALYQALGNNELVAILPDQDPRENSGQFAPFFGYQANTMTLLSRLAQKTGATVLATYAERLPNGQGFAIHFCPTPQEIHDKDMATSVRALNESVEEVVRRIPQQYQWGYKRFRTRPEDEPEIYD
ncbi:lysophospholipid acyltransferase family protein [Pseudomonadota bacterium]